MHKNSLWYLLFWLCTNLGKLRFKQAVVVKSVKRKFVITVGRVKVWWGWIQFVYMAEILPPLSHTFDPVSIGLLFISFKHRTVAASIFRRQLTSSFNPLWRLFGCVRSIKYRISTATFVSHFREFLLWNHLRLSAISAVVCFRGHGLSRCYFNTTTYTVHLLYLVVDSNLLYSVDYGDSAKCSFRIWQQTHWWSHVEYLF